MTVFVFTSKVTKIFTHSPNGDSEELLSYHNWYVSRYAVINLIYFIINRVQCIVV